MAWRPKFVGRGAAAAALAGTTGAAWAGPPGSRMRVLTIASSAPPRASRRIEGSLRRHEKGMDPGRPTLRTPSWWWADRDHGDELTVSIWDNGEPANREPPTSSQNGQNDAVLPRNRLSLACAAMLAVAL